MISKKSAAEWGKKLNIDPVKLKAAIDADDEQDIDIPADVKVFKGDVTAFSKEELATRDKSKYDEGADAGVEVAVKTFKKENSLDFKGKDLKSLHEHLTTKGEDKEVVEKLRGTILEKEKALAEALSKADSVELQSEVLGYIPELNNGMTKKEAMSVMQANGFEFKKEDGKTVAYKNGSKLKDDKLQTEIGADTAIKSFFTDEKKWTGDADSNNVGKGGRGGDNSKPKPTPLYTKASEVEKAFNDKHGAGASMGTEYDYAGHLKKAMADAETAGTPLVMD